MKAIPNKVVLVKVCVIISVWFFSVVWGIPVCWCLNQSCSCKITCLQGAASPLHVLTLSYGPIGLSCFVLPRIEGNYRFKAMTSLSVLARFEDELCLCRETFLRKCCACVESSNIIIWSKGEWHRMKAEIAVPQPAAGDHVGLRENSVPKCLLH